LLGFREAWVEVSVKLDGMGIAAFRGDRFTKFTWVSKFYVDGGRKQQCFDRGSAGEAI
jgi:hypothetical protein